MRLTAHRGCCCAACRARADAVFARVVEVSWSASERACLSMLAALMQAEDRRVEYMDMIGEGTEES